MGKQFKEYENKELKERYLSKYFKCVNSFNSCHKTKEGYWNIYYFIFSVSENGMLKTIRHERTLDGEIKIGKEIKNQMFFVDSKIIEISKEEYCNAWNLIVDKITDFMLIF